jgi:hypothetical protein
MGDYCLAAEYQYAQVTSGLGTQQGASASPAESGCGCRNVLCLVQSLRRNVGAIRPANSPATNEEFLEELHVAERFEDFAAKPRREVNDFLAAIAEPKMETMPRMVTGFRDGDQFFYAALILAEQPG